VDPHSISIFDVTDERGKTEWRQVELNGSGSCQSVRLNRDSRPEHWDR
jgi:hypothetical protein